MTALTLVRQLWAGHRWPLLAVGLLLVVNVALGLYLHYRLVPAVSQAEQVLIRRQKELRSDAAEGSSPVQQFIRGEAALAAFRGRVAPHQEFTGLIVELQELADEAGLELDKVNYRHDLDRDNQLLRYQLTFSISGSYREVKRFVHALEQSSRLIAIEQLALQEVGEDDGTLVQLQISLETFFRNGAS
jgi:Tfp pilus assembly protein PilO